MIDNPQQPESTLENLDPSQPQNSPYEREPRDSSGDLEIPAEVQAEVVEADDGQQLEPDDASSFEPSATVPEDEVQSETDRQAEIATLRQELEQQRKQADAYKAQSVRIAADFDNFRKRTEREQVNLVQQTKRTTISELLSVVDNFERARVQIKPNNDGELAIHKSYQGVYKNFVDSLKRIGVSAMRPEGQPFDPNYHEALLQEPTDEYPDGTVVEQLVRGYMLGDQVLRHAQVKVSVGGTSSAAEPEASSAAED